ncbi:MAG: endonuclease/exonuclease/phosphatase family protein [Qingshengfaniella sp.]
MGLVRFLFGVLAVLGQGVMPVAAETVRLAMFNVALDRDGPGLLLRDLKRGDDQARAAALTIAAAAPDILVLARFDYDLHGVALAEFARLVVAQGGPDYPHHFALRPNAGWATGLDLDGDGRLGGPGDAQGYGTFAGQGGLALLSRYPIDQGSLRDFSDLLWCDLPGATLPMLEDQPFYDATARAVLRLSSVGHWVLRIKGPDAPLWVGAFHATTPVFDGPEDRNGLRNRDEIRFWSLFLDGAFGPPPNRFVLLGDANLDPQGGEGHHQTIRDLLIHPGLQDPGQRTINGDRATGLWEDRPGPLRVDYALPSADLQVTGSGLTGTGDGTGLGATLAEAGLDPPLHRLVWVDVDTGP